MDSDYNRRISTEKYYISHEYFHNEDLESCMRKYVQLISREERDCLFETMRSGIVLRSDVEKYLPKYFDLIGMSRAFQEILDLLKGYRDLTIPQLYDIVSSNRTIPFLMKKGILEFILIVIDIRVQLKVTDKTPKHINDTNAFNNFKEWYITHIYSGAVPLSDYEKQLLEMWNNMGISQKCDFENIPPPPIFRCLNEHSVTDKTGYFEAFLYHHTQTNYPGMHGNNNNNNYINYQLLQKWKSLSIEERDLYHW